MTRSAPLGAGHVDALGGLAPDIREHGVPRKIDSVTLTAPGVDVDVFRPQVAAIKAPATKWWYA